MAKRLTLDAVLQHGKQHGYEVLSDYVNARTKMRIRWLECGHDDLKNFDSLYQGHRCGLCRYSRSGPRPLRITLEIISARGRERGFEVLSTEYVDSKTPIHIRWVACGHEQWKSSNYLSRGFSCGECSPWSNRYTIDDIVAHGRANGYEVLSSTYVPKEKLVVRYPCGHVVQQYWDNLRDGCRCNDCRAVTLSDVIERGHIRGFEVLSTAYERKKDYKLHVRWFACLHEEFKTLDSLTEYGCTICNRGWSRDRILTILSSISTDLEHLTPAQRQIVLERSKYLDGLKKPIQRAIIRGDFFTDDERSQARKLDEILGTDSGTDADYSDDGSDDEDLSTTTDKLDKLAGMEREIGYGDLSSDDVAAKLDTFDGAVSKLTKDEAAIEELISLEVDKMWNAALNAAA